MTSLKIKGFEYLMKQCLIWFRETHQNHPNDFSKLKAIKLLFFVSSVNASDKDTGLLELFDNYWALPFGHVESDVYNNFHEMQLFKIDSETLSDNTEETINYFDELGKHIEQITESISFLKLNYPDFINYTAYELVELSHQWKSWITTFDLAKQLNRKSLKIPLPLLLSETKIFTLN